MGIENKKSQLKTAGGLNISPKSLRKDNPKN